VQEIHDANGRLLARTDPPLAGDSAPRVIDERNAWLMDSMMRDVITRGTATRARALNRGDLAGKTGTTNDYVDAWFSGYNPDLVAVAWMGFSQPRNLGRGETGGAAALPIWVNYMRTALDGVPERERPRPEGLATAHAGGREDYYYAENAHQAAPVASQESPPDWLREMFASDARPALEAPEEAIPTAPAALAPAQAPAPVEDRAPVMIRR
jgi:penicillin-binding protein 1A